MKLGWEWDGSACFLPRKGQRTRDRSIGRPGRHQQSLQPEMPPLLLLLLLLAATLLHVGLSDTVAYDHRGLIINGQHRMLISASIHYPRAAPQMWSQLISNAKAGGIDVIETYVFWDGHQPTRDTYNFEGRFDLVSFVKLVHEAGLYANLRIGPYVCAEWNLGGFPVWLKDVPGIEFRTNNQPFKAEMQAFVEKIVAMMKHDKLFAPQGGPIILAQIENEYGNIDAAYGAAGKEYMEWAANMAQGLGTGVPWIMCQQSDAPDYILDTCNGFYCDAWAPNNKKKPKMWTENWSGWFQKWGEASPHRPVEDVAFAVARFFQRGGSFQNYYMYFGGTNFGRSSGGPYVTTSYDYDAPIDEFGVIRQPKWGHLKQLHAAIKLCEAALGSNDPTYISLGQLQEAHVYGSTSSGACAAFLANIDSSSDATVKFNSRTYLLPAWSVSILPDCKTVSHNTAKVSHSLSLLLMLTMKHFYPKVHVQTAMPTMKPSITGLAWESYPEPVGVWSDSGIVASALLEQINTTKDTSDYLWYTTSLDISQADAASGKALLSLESMRDVVHVFVNGKLAGSASTKGTQLYAAVEQPIELASGHNSLAILCATVGLQNYGPFIETWGAGINGSVIVKGLPSGQIDLTAEEWIHQVGLKGESLAIFTESGSQRVRWSSAVPQGQALVWYKAHFDSPSGNDPVALDLESMGKGQAWINGQSIGRFWPSLRAPDTAGCPQTCDYRGSYSSSKCRSGCGQPSQRWYHVPRSWLQDSGNLVVLFEEEGGKPSGVSFVTRTVV
ncbi:beta-galactosidase 8 isoform X1 [Selaginella moellendorffii]|uniref:beta-galactosidase 8 isoform X1 n=1 Tax=Selaginella moellendorffii TaxID=88036 RepID=UPI000D1CFA0C|nr:beta-galactosidase 8 isoform X1 [Selaginella moellendorffii]|eukprot:XP_024518549.1 beta-galactosidase 8 isoform X1 [Selaginella moellendorffii]